MSPPSCFRTAANATPPSESAARTIFRTLSIIATPFSVWYLRGSLAVKSSRLAAVRRPVADVDWRRRADSLPLAIAGGLDEEDIAADARFLGPAAVAGLRDTPLRPEPAVGADFASTAAILSLVTTCAGARQAL